MAKQTRTMNFYKSYTFKDKDPVIDDIRGLIDGHDNKHYEQVHADSGVSVSTLRNWFHGGTLRPQFATIKAVARAIGGDVVVVAPGMPGYDQIQRARKRMVRRVARGISLRNGSAHP